MPALLPMLPVRQFLLETVPNAVLIAAVDVCEQYTTHVASEKVSGTFNLSQRKQNPSGVFEGKHQGRNSLFFLPSPTT